MLFIGFGKSGSSRSRIRKLAKSQSVIFNARGTRILKRGGPAKAGALLRLSVKLQKKFYTIAIGRALKETGIESKFELWLHMEVARAIAKNLERFTVSCIWRDKSRTEIRRKRWI